MYNFSCISCLESLNDVSLPCGTGDGSQNQIYCIEKINTSCVFYNGSSFPCLAIVDGSKLNDVIATLCSNPTCSSPCDIDYDLTYSCETGHVLTYNNNIYSATWVYKDPVTNDWEYIDPDLVEKTTKLVPGNTLEITETIRDYAAIVNCEIKVILDSGQCDFITIIKPAENDGCPLLERCENSNAVYAILPGTTNTLVEYELQTAPPLTNEYIDWFRCYYLNITDSLSCGLQDYETIYRAQRDAYLQRHASNIINLQNGTSLQPSVPAPVAHISDWFNSGPFSVNNPNFVYAKYPVFHGCGCEVDGQHFQIRPRPQVQTLSELSNVTGTLGEIVYIVSLTEWYAWDVNTSSWIEYALITNVNGQPFYATDQPGIPGDFEHCLDRKNARRNTYQQSLNQFLLAWQPFNVSALIVPTYFLKRHLDETLPTLDMTCNCVTP